MFLMRHEHGLSSTVDDDYLSLLEMMSFTNGGRQIPCAQRRGGNVHAASHSS